MTSIIIAALGVALAAAALLRAGSLFRQLRYARQLIAERDAKIARLTPLAEIGLRRVKAVEKYEAKHRGVTK